TEDETAAAYARASSYLSRTHYGLDTAKVRCVERLGVEDPGPEAREWLRRRIGEGGERLLAVFGSREGGAVRACFFLERWQDLFCPSRDDVVILPEEGAWVLFYCHEDEFEFGQAGER